MFSMPIIHLDKKRSQKGANHPVIEQIVLKVNQLSTVVCKTQYCKRAVASEINTLIRLLSELRDR